MISDASGFIATLYPSSTSNAWPDNAWGQCARPENAFCSGLSRFWNEHRECCCWLHGRCVGPVASCQASIMPIKPWHNSWMASMQAQGLRMLQDSKFLCLVISCSLTARLAAAARLARQKPICTVTPLRYVYATQIKVCTTAFTDSGCLRSAIFKK